MKRILGPILTILLSYTSCQLEEDKLFVNLPASQTKVDFNNQLSSRPELNILNYLYYYNGAGVATADFNNDGLIDLYFTGNQVSDELYLNKGQLVFEKITEQAGLKDFDGWSTGVTYTDINNDGLLDIYVCKASGYRSLKGHNLLFVNQGTNDEGIPTFKEESVAYGLDFSGLSTQSAFFDFDLDGDLDMYLMNHSVHPNRTYGRGNQRSGFDPISGDILFENQNGRFYEISEEAGIFQGKSGYGLGISISDVNEDGYPDIYIGNDFFENDYLYINQKNKTFKEIISVDDNRLGHTTHYSMGNAIADMNNDGLVDIVSLDMLPEDLETYKTSGLEYGYPIYQQYLKNGYAPQFMQNTFHLNLGDERFAEIGNLSGIAATEWSWGVLAADFDNDGFKDLFISNGIQGATNDMDYMNFIANEDIQKRIDAGMAETDMPLINEIPEKKATNYFFKNNADLTFTNSTEEWSKSSDSFSNGCAYADLDNDGDLDIIVNNVNEIAHIWENLSKSGNFLQLDFKGENGNIFGFGAKAIAYTPTKKITQANFNTTGYLSASTHRIHFGLGKDSIVDSLRVVWPNQKVQVLKSVKTNSLINIYQKNAAPIPTLKEQEKLQVDHFDSIIPFVHIEKTSLDFDREPLVPFSHSNEGPCVSVADYNGDKLDDIFIGGAKKQASALYIQTGKGSFEKQQQDLFEEDATSEDTASCFFDADGDGQIDLLVGSGGNEFVGGTPLQPRLYLNKNGVLKRDTLQFIQVEANISKIKSVDFDNDGDFDVMLASDAVTTQYGQTPKQYLFQNNGKGQFKDITAEYGADVAYVGNVKDFQWVDLNKDGFEDLIVAGHWMPITIFFNTGKELLRQTNNGLQNTHGWWNNIEMDDFDNDGDLDLVAGNWGLNTKLKASSNRPSTLYNNDFDDNQTIDPIITYFHKNQETPFASKDELVKQLPFLNKKYLRYIDFAQASISELFGAKKLADAEKKQVFELRSCFFENKGNGIFKMTPLPLMAQASQVNASLAEDFNNDGFKDLLIVGNNYEISTQLGRLDAFHGLILTNDKNGGFVWERHQNLNLSGASRTLDRIEINGLPYYIIGRNNNSPIFLAIKQKNK
ncbi:MAG: VCBS repeat-containing protein [Croceitalea sp.]|nr:VCBS repeat-containing protein [Croceitalea sp.]